MINDEWKGCFSQTWGNFLNEDCMRHPAKFNRGVIERIRDHLLNIGALKRGHVVLDPFGGVASGSILFAYRDIKWIGFEIEPHFVEAGNKYIHKHSRTLETQNLPVPQLFQGDSRKLNRGLVDAILSGPPLLDVIQDDKRKEGSHAHLEKHRRGRHKASADQGYGESKGQFADMPEGETPTLVNAIVSSPPYGNVTLDQNSDPEKAGERMRRKGLSEKRIKHNQSNAMRNNYGTSKGQMGSDRSDESTFWESAEIVLSNCYDLLKPGGISTWVVRDFIRDKKIIPFGDQWAGLCVAVGFIPKCRHRAMMKNVVMKPDLFDGEREVVSKNYKSAFRRQYEKKHNIGIHWDDVMCFTKPKE